MAIPFNKPYLVGTEFAYMQEALQEGHISGDGPFTRRCEELLERSLGVRRVLLTTSCTHALEMAALLLDIRPGDEVIAPSSLSSRRSTPSFSAGRGRSSSTSVRTR